ncbi:hypothetical protein AAHN97_00430 [Chitinophaga niabensis]|uniref:fimbrial biogenesis chaperone n=1 Tax=Chitinophaga niabensis TaxID=536979 RepID=UPI0031BABEC0
MKKCAIRCGVVGIFSFFFYTNASAQGGLLVTPGRIVFEGSKRIQELNLANNGTDTATYQVSFIDIRMNENGTFEQVTTPDSGQFFAKNNLRIFPRSITLAPNEAQSVKLQLINSNQLPPAEYRSHIYFRAIPVEKPLGEQLPVKDSSGISVRLKPVFGITIPVIVRVGGTTASMNISEVSLSMGEDKKYQLNMTFNRMGNRSVYGDLKVNHISSTGKITLVGEINGIAVYTPTARRRLSILLNEKPGINYKSGKLQIIYASPADAKSSKIAETEYALF